MAKEKKLDEPHVTDRLTVGPMTPEAEALARLIGELIAARWRKMNASDHVLHKDRKEHSDDSAEAPPK